MSYNTEWYFYSSGGDCANFVSQSLFAGGYQFDDTWFNYDSSSAANYCSHPRYTWIRAHELRDYLVANGGIMIHNPKPSDFSLGDAVFYDWEQNGRIDHSAIVTAIDNGIPKVSYHSADGSTRLDEYWTMGKSEACCYLIKLNGNTCSNNNAQSYTHYRIKNSVKAKDIKIMSQPGSGTVLGTGDGYNIRYNSGIRVFREQNGWGYFNYYGTWGWIDLSLCTKIGTWNKIEVGHSMSGWYTYILPTCKTPGVKLNECTKCDYFEKQEISKISHTYKAATCTSARYCTMCGATEGSALGHNWSSTVTNPTCVSEGKKVSSCTRCNITKTETISKVDHSWSNYTTTKQPTCTQNGIETSICSVCSTKRTRSTAALGHNMEEITVSASCLTEGTTTSRCTRCSYTKHSDSSAALGHDYQTTVTIANCTENGCTTYVCSRCNDTYTDSSSEWSAWTETYDATAPEGKIKEENGLYSYIQIAWGHNFSVTDSAQATCTENGHTTQTCSRCQLEETENIDALGHIWGEWTDNKNGSHSRICGRDASHIETADHIWYNGTMTVAPTCETAGTMEYTCEICSGTSTETIDPIGHDYYLDEDMSVAPTCAEDGYDYHTCANNPAHYYKEVLTATGHNMSEQTDYPPETGCGEGKKVSECTKDDCDYFEEEYYFIEHSYGDEIYVPGNCGFESYSYIECEKCSSSLIFIGEIDPNNHANYETEIIDAVDPTCEEDGYTGDTICMQCSGIKEAGQIIPATGHDWNDWETITAATCETDGLKKRVCKNDETHIEENILTATGHTWNEGVIDPDSTCTTHGIKTFTCQNDANHTYTENIDPDENNHVGDTYIKDAKEPDCTNDGYTGDTYCSDCDKNLANGAVIPALKHDMGEWYTVTAATCTTNGLEKSDCSRCDYSEERKTSIDSDNHYPETFYTVYIKADCENSGKKSHHCERCDTPLDNITIPAKGHSYDNGATTTAPTCTTDGVKTFTCQNDTTDEYSACAHSYTEAIPATGHDWDDGVIDPESTCNTHGTKTYTCQNDASHTKTEEVPLDENNHVGDTYLKDAKEPDCTNDGYTGDTYCSDCDKKLESGEIIPTTGHTWGARETVKAPTYTEQGEEKRVCSKGDAEETRSLPVLTRPSDENENIETEKTVEYDSATGEAVIKLVASSKGEKITVNSRTPLDIVLVLDQSGSMEGDLLKKLKTATEDFTNAIYQDALENNIDHRIAMVGFAMQNQYNFGSEYPQYLNTEVLTTGGAPVKYNSLSTSKMNEVYKNALVSVNVDGALNPVLTLAKDNLEAKGATAADLGLDMACQIFAQNENDGSRKRIVVFMTDGVPTYKSDYMEETATNATTKANLLKDAYEADLYSVGVLSGSNTSKAKTFLNNIASKDENNKALYFDCADADKLVEDFQTIATQSTTVTTDFADITLVDTISSAFTLTALQENELRKNAIEKLGITNDDITITRYADGTTEVKLEHINPVAVSDGDDINYVIDIDFRVSANEKALVAGSYGTNTDNAGVLVGTSDVYENNFAVPGANVENAEGVIYFTVNGIVYHIVRVHKGDSPEAPEFTLDGEYTFSGWDIPDEVVFDGGKLTVEATLTQKEYTITWNTADKTTVDTYHAGDIIDSPTVGLNSNGEEFLGWNKTVPVTMPAENLEFTATYGTHEHSYTEKVLKKVSCGVEGKIQHICTCGDSYMETIDALEHNWSTSATSTDGSETAYSHVYCENCGASPDKTLSYKITGKSGSKEVSYDLKLTDAENITVQPDGNITISLPVPSNMKNAKNVKIYRVEEDGTKTNLNGTVKNGYITFTTDHFSIYIVEAVYDCDEAGIHTDENTDNICDLCGDNLKGNDKQEEQTTTCTHLCHKSGFMNFLWKIARFFCKLFNMEAYHYCDCGAAHW